MITSRPIFAMLATALVLAQPGSQEATGTPLVDAESIIQALARAVLDDPDPRRIYTSHFQIREPKIAQERIDKVAASSEFVDLEVAGVRFRVPSEEADILVLNSRVIGEGGEIILLVKSDPEAVWADLCNEVANGVSDLATDVLHGHGVEDPEGLIGDRAQRLDFANALRHVYRAAQTTTDDLIEATTTEEAIDLLLRLEMKFWLFSAIDIDDGAAVVRRFQRQNQVALVFRNRPAARAPVHIGFMIFDDFELRTEGFVMIERQLEDIEALERVLIMPQRAAR